MLFPFDDIWFRSHNDTSSTQPIQCVMTIVDSGKSFNGMGKKFIQRKMAPNPIVFISASYFRIRIPPSQSLSLAMDPYKHRPSSAFNTPFWTTNSGAPVWNNNSSLTVGSRGPILLEDYHLIEKLANFDRERIPERVVHARGASAKGFFEVTHDISNLSCADFLRAPGVQTPVIVRFSTVIHERGSPETLRDPRGFAVKFYTREGNFDLVGNNFPVFFIRDGMKFPDMVHALKPNPKSHIQENWRILDFFSHHPESLHMFSFLFDDLGVPQDYRHMEGSGVNTYTLINKAGKAHYVKFHWKPTCGVKCLLDDEAVKVGGANHSHATQDLYDSIAAGNYPEWKLFIQTIDPDHEDRFDFDPVDVTKTWPEDILPLQPVGRLVLNKNIDNFFAENEQLAFCPAIVVPGVYYSDDKLLQTRIFSYADTQRHRLGPNYLQLPANAPKCAHHNNHYDGFMNFMHRDEEIDYFPSRYDPVRHAQQHPIPPAICSGKREKCIIDKENNFKQPGERYRSFSADRQERFICRWVDALSDPRVTHEIRSIWISYWSQADKTLGQKLASRLNTIAYPGGGGGGTAAHTRFKQGCRHQIEVEAGATGAICVECADGGETTQMPTQKSKESCRSKWNSSKIHCSIFHALLPKCRETCEEFDVCEVFFCIQFKLSDSFPIAFEIFFLEIIYASTSFAKLDYQPLLLLRALERIPPSNKIIDGGHL
ncbi:hypothetical protein QYF36_011623 [Acer negundo]|nr:hypothetical protein QYF36_011623 [Acer negundo]